MRDVAWLVRPARLTFCSAIADYTDYNHRTAGATCRRLTFGALLPITPDKGNRLASKSVLQSGSCFGFPNDFAVKNLGIVKPAVTKSYDFFSTGAAASDPNAVNANNATSGMCPSLEPTLRTIG